MPDIDLTDLARRLTRDELAELLARHASSHPWPLYAWDIEERALLWLVELQGSVTFAADAWGVSRNKVYRALQRKAPAARRKA